MTAHLIVEDLVEQVCLEWFQDLGYEYSSGPDIAPGEPLAERTSYEDVVLLSRLEQALRRLNPDVPFEVLEDASRKITHIGEPTLTSSNRIFHWMLADGFSLDGLDRRTGHIRGYHIRLADSSNPNNNDWLVVNQFTVQEGKSNRRPDIVVFLNGLPVAVFELKNASSEGATIWEAYKQIQTYKSQIPSLFVTNELLVLSDGMETRIGSLTSGKERFSPWRTIDGVDLDPPGILSLEILVRGLFQKERLLDYIRYAILFEDDNGSVQKKIAGYHQFHATRQAVTSTLSAVKGDRRAGVIWHTQGSGKSLTMVCYARKLILEPAMENPTLVVLTDRNDLDGQLFATFSRCRDALRQIPVQAESRAHLRNLLTVPSGGIIFTTIQKFFPDDRDDIHPTLSGRRNIVVIADEAHRSQYDFLDGYARHMRDALPGASFIGFTGTPIETTDKNTKAVFGEYVSIYDIKQAVDDKATVPIYYESRLAKLSLKEDEKPHIDDDFEEVTEGEEEKTREKLKTKWAQLEAVVGSEKRVEVIARDLVDHFVKRLDAMDGKAMVVCMSRRICVDLYNEIIRIRPSWHSDDDKEGFLKVVMTGSATDPVEWQQHIRDKRRRNDLATNFKTPESQFKMVIVRDMWLTGFDAPSLHTMYLDKPMKDHGLMQTIARVNRVFRDKPGGLIVDYIGLAEDLKKAMATYTESKGKGEVCIDQHAALKVLEREIEVCRDLLHGLDWQSLLHLTSKEWLLKLPSVIEHILRQDDGKNRWISAVDKISKSFALSVPLDGALALRDEIAHYQTIRTSLAKREGVQKAMTMDEREIAIRQIVSGALSTGPVIDLFDAAGLKKPDVSLLSDEFLDQVRAIPQKNLAIELLRRLLEDDIKARSKKNLVQSRSFAEMLEKTLLKYKNRAITTVEVIQDLIDLARQINETGRRGIDLGLNDDELAFYDALETNDSAVQLLGDETLRKIAQELTDQIHKNVTLDWTMKEQVRAKLRSMVKRILRKYRYPPDKQERATETVLQQAELICSEMR